MTLEFKVIVLGDDNSEVRDLAEQGQGLGVGKINKSWGFVTIEAVKSIQGLAPLVDHSVSLASGLGPRFNCVGEAHVGERPFLGGLG